MNIPHSALSMLAMLLLSACSAAETDTANSADDFAARINGGDTPNAQATVAPTVAPPRENAAPGAFAPGTATDPESATCAANMMGPYLGKLADEATRSAIDAAAFGAASEVRFVAPGGDYISPDPTSSRLNLMLDNQGIIRDARCG